MHNEIAQRMKSQVKLLIARKPKIFVRSCCILTCTRFLYSVHSDSLFSLIYITSLSLTNASCSHFALQYALTCFYYFLILYTCSMSLFLMTFNALHSVGLAGVTITVN